MAIDLGRKRCGIAVTDTARIAANALDTVSTAALVDFIKSYIVKEPVDEIIVGEPRDMHDRPSECRRFTTPVLNRLRRECPGIPIRPYDERFTSVLAHRAMLDGGLRRNERRDKTMVDRISAAIILNDYLQSVHYNSL